MTETRPPYTIAAPTEAEIQAAVVEALERGGWEVTVTSQDRATRRHLRGLPDLLAIRDDRVLFVECKTARGRLRQSQQEWRERHERHFGAHVRYVVVRAVEDIEEWLGWGRAWMSDGG